MKPEEIARSIAENFANGKGSPYLSTERNGVFHLQSTIAQALARVRAEAIEECAKVQCQRCAQGIQVLKTTDGWEHDDLGRSWPCHSSAIRALGGGEK